MSVELRTLFKLIAVLEHSEEFKKVLFACERHFESGYCKCGPMEMCNIALAEAMKEDPTLVLRKWRRVFTYLEEVGIIKTRKLEAPANRPRRYIKLSENWMEALRTAIDKEYEKLIR